MSLNPRRPHPLGPILAALLLCATVAAASDAQPVSVGWRLSYFSNARRAGTQTFVSLAAATRDGSVRVATFGWSASPCPAAVELKFFRPHAGTDLYDFVDQRGPFDVTEPMQTEHPFRPLVTQTVALHPAVALHKGDVIAITNRTACGGPTYTNISGGGIPQFSNLSFTVDGDPTSSVRAVPPLGDPVYVKAVGRLVNQWSPLGPDAPISSVAVAPGVLLAGVGVRLCPLCPDGGLLRSGDDGQNWDDVFPGRATDAIAVAPSDPNVAYAARRDAAIEVWKSVDRGVTWAPTTPGPAGVRILRVDPFSPGTVWAGADAGLFRTADGGATWMRVLDRPSIASLAISPSAPSTVYAGSLGYGGFRTTDGGGTWVSLPGLGVPNIPTGLTAIDVESLAVDPEDAKRVVASARVEYIGTALPPFPSFLYRSADGGESWLPTNQFGGLLVATPSPPGVFYATGFEGILRRSVDGGATWAPVGPPQPFPPIEDLAVDPDDPSTLYAATPSGVQRLTADPTTLMLGSGRFEARVTWRTAEGGGTAAFLPLTEDTGAFWFFTPSNLEVAVKVLDGRAENGKFWVFGGQLTDVEYTLEITDTATGAVWTHHNPAGTLASFADTTAF